MYPTPRSRESAEADTGRWTAALRVCALPEPRCKASGQDAAALGLLTDKAEVEGRKKAYISRMRDEDAQLLEEIRGSHPDLRDFKDVPDAFRQFVFGAGVSVSFLKRMVGLVDGWYPGAKTRDVAMKYIKPLTEANRCRFYEQMPEGQVRRPDLFVSHMQDAQFTAVMGDVLDKLADADPEDTFVGGEVPKIANYWDFGRFRL